jgi:hypothetical protein
MVFSLNLYETINAYVPVVLEKSYHILHFSNFPGCYFHHMHSNVVLKKLLPGVCM